MIRHTFRAMGTKVIVIAETLRGIRRTVTLFQDVEARCSRFMPNSELSRANDAPGVGVELSPELAEVLGAAEAVRGLTGGLVDAGLGAPVIDWGYDRSFTEVTDRPGPEPVPAGRLVWRLEGRTLVRSPGTRLDVGGVAKGWTADRAVEAGHAQIVNAGGDVRSSDPEAIVEIEDPWGETATDVELGVGALATSSVSRRRWSVGGREVHHLIDPRTMAPAATPVLSATAMCGTATEAEAAAKSVLMRGAEGLAWAADQDWIESALVVWQDGGVYGTAARSA